MEEQIGFLLNLKDSRKLLNLLTKLIDSKDRRTSAEAARILMLITRSIALEEN